MNERRMLHPTYILFGVLSIIRGFLPLLLILFIRGIEWSELEWYWFAGIGAGLVLLVVMSFLQWKKFGFWMEEDRIIIRQGLLFREEKTIYYSRIHSVNVEQPLIQRLLGVAQLKIETPGGNKKSDGILHTLSLDDANRIKQQLRDYSQTQGKKVSVEEKSAEGVVLESSIDSSIKEVDLVNQAEIVHAEEPVSQRAQEATDQHKGPEVALTLGTSKLFQAAATSLNFGLAIAFIGGLYSFADDFMELLLPDHFLENVVEDSTSLMSSTLLIVVVGVAVLCFAWLLSIVLYILKYSGFTIHRDGKQVSLSYGLLEKKTVLFDPKNVQAVITNESLLRQPFGYAEVKLQVVSSDKNEQLMLHPFLKVAEIQGLLNEFVPHIQLHNGAGLALSPKKGLLFYIRIPLLIVTALCAGCIAYFGAVGAWSLLLIPLIIWWRICCHRSAGVLMQDGQLTLRRRFISQTTYYVRKPRIVTMKVIRSNAQRRKKIISISVQVLGSAFPYKVSYMSEGDIEPVWKWYSRRRT